MKSPLSCLFLLLIGQMCLAGTRTWDGKYDTSNIEVSVVYFVPADRRPLPDWRERVEYFCQRIERFHQREFQDQSNLKTNIHAEPFISQRSTNELRRGDANAIYYRTLEETDRRLNFAGEPSESFRILLVLSEINWRPLDDFYRLKPAGEALVFEGNYNRGEHFPGAAAGGARASYLADRGIGWGLVSADGWRVPYRGSDCVIYHEGCGHTVGLPHPEPGNGSVMSLGQYRGWLSESWLDRDQKERLGWKPQATEANPPLDLFSRFRAVPQPAVPKPHQEVFLQLNWPQDAKVKELRVRLQTDLTGPWFEVPQRWTGDAPQLARLGTFDRPTPISYRIDATLGNGASCQLWGYLQVRNNPNQLPLPYSLSLDLIEPSSDTSSAVLSLPDKEIELLERIDVSKCWKVGEWSMDQGRLLSPKRYAARIELPYTLPKAYRLTAIVEPLDKPNGLILGLRSGESRFLALTNYATERGDLSALENVDGRNVGNDTTFVGAAFRQDRPSQVIVTVRGGKVTVSVDGRTIIDWHGVSDRLSLSDYWKTPNETCLFLGAYDCRYRFHRVTLEPLEESAK